MLRSFEAGSDGHLNCGLEEILMAREWRGKWKKSASRLRLSYKYDSVLMGQLEMLAVVNAVAVLYPHKSILLNNFLSFLKNHVLFLQK